ncbi:MAG: c-type cytochrome [Nitrospirota bacterium]|nr:c-type cytochrome [Nitrospirota bacterium]MDE3242991.1 c-type cytochrome [Nitrospirota bacterium]
MPHLRVLLLVPLLAGMPVSVAFPAEQHMMAPRVPPDKLAEARALQSPLPDSPDVIEKGKALYEGKGACFNCHGKGGQGDGPAAMGLDPSPRNFHHRGFWRHRTDGEIFWVIKHGSPGTAMIGFGGELTDEDIWSLVRYLRGFAGEAGHRGGMGQGPGMGPGMGGRHEGGCCDRSDASP